jgi:subtilisin-like proprotein convertase family protein
MLIVLMVTAVFTLLFTSLVTADSAARTVYSDDAQQREPDPVTNLGGASIVITKTVGTSVEACAVAKTIFVEPGTLVTYCYEVTNIGATSLSLHDLEDSELGVLLDDFFYTLTPGASAFLTSSAEIDISTVNTATWTAFNAGPTDVTSVGDGATVIASSLNACRFPVVAIPDNVPAGITDTLSLNAGGEIVDLDVYLEVDHTWVGDLRFVLEHVDSGITTTLINRPGNPPTTFGCGRSDIRAIMDDEAGANAETTCTWPIALAGRFVGGDPANSSLLTAFDGDDLSGEWRLIASDTVGGFAGTLQSWCLLPTLAAPKMGVTPDHMAVTQSPNTQSVYPLNLQNSGNTALDWHVFESAVGVTAVAPPVALFAPQPEMAASFVPGAAAERVDSVLDEAAVVDEGTAVTAPVAAPVGNVLYDNGPLVNMPGGGAGGADASVLQTVSQAMVYFGYGHQVAMASSVADDFTVTDANGWFVDQITFFAYQTGSTTDSTITGVNYRIWDGPPDDPNSHILIYPTMPNRLASTQWSGIYRVAETALGATDRPIMQNTVHGGFALPAGTYWLEWQSDGSLGSGPWAPPITVSGTITTGNAIQYAYHAWLPLTDGGAQGLPFIISGQVLSEIPWASVAPAAGSLPSGATDVQVTFDTTGMVSGVYTGNLLVAGNDPDIPFVTVPLTLTVGLNEIYLPMLTKP